MKNTQRSKIFEINSKHNLNPYTVLTTADKNVEKY